MNNKSCEYCGFVHNVNLHPKCPRCRDAFAMATLTGIYADGAWTSSAKFCDIAKDAYLTADAMIAEREVKPVG